MNGSNFIATPHAIERMFERFPKLRLRTELKNLLFCTTEETLELKRTKSYRDIPKGEKDLFEFYKSERGVFFITKQKKQKDDTFNNVIITVLSEAFCRANSEDNIEFKRQAAQAEEKMLELNSMSYVERKKLGLLNFSEEEKELKTKAKREKRQRAAVRRQEKLFDSMQTSINNSLVYINRNDIFSSPISLFFNEEEHSMKSAQSFFTNIKKIVRRIAQVRTFYSEQNEEEKVQFEKIQTNVQELIKFVLNVRNITSKHVLGCDDFVEELNTKAFETVIFYYEQNKEEVNGTVVLEMLETIEKMKIKFPDSDAFDYSGFGDLSMLYFENKMTDMYVNKRTVSISNLNKLLFRMNDLYSYVVKPKSKTLYNNVYSFFEIVLKETEKTEDGVLSLSKIL